MKFKEEALEELGKNFETDELEFIIQFKKTGDLETIIQFKKTYQAAFKNLIDGMSKQLNVSEDKTDKKVNDEKVENVEEDKDEVIEGDQISEKSKTADVKYERKNLQNVCKFYRSGKCIHGMSGKSHDKRGNICPFDHPEICKKYKLYENTEKVCQNKDCNKRHVNLLGLMLILGDMNIDLDKMEEKDYYLDKLASEYQTMIGENGLEVIDFGTTWKRPDRDGTEINHALTNKPEILSS